MADDDIEDVSPSSSHPFIVRAEYFTSDDSDTHGSTKENTEEIVDAEENDDNEERNNLLISQPKYSQLLKELDFSHSRMVDVTNLLSDEGNYLTPDENDNQKKMSSDEKYQSLSSISSTEVMSPLIFDNTEKDQTKEDEDLQNASNDIQEESTKKYDNEQGDIQKKPHTEEEDDTSKQATQNYDLNDNEQGNFAQYSNSNKNLRYNAQYSNSTQDENLSSIPRLNTSTNTRPEAQEQENVITWDNLVNGAEANNQPAASLIFSMPVNGSNVTPIKQQSVPSSVEKTKQRPNSSPKQKAYPRSRQLSISSDTDSDIEHSIHRTKQKQQSLSQPQLSKPDNHEISMDEDLDDLNTHLNQVILDQDQPSTTASDILLRHLSNQPIDRHSSGTSLNRKKIHHKQSTSRHAENIPSKNNDTWLTTLEKLEREHKERLDKQQKQYEEYMLDLEGKMKQRLDEYISTTNSLQESKSENLNESIHLYPTDCSNAGRYRTSSYAHQYRPLAKDPINHYYPKLDKQQPIATILSRSQSREDISNVRIELSTKHAKHISDLKLYYDNEIDELKNQLNRLRMGHSTSATRQSIETIERINNENIRLHDEVKELRRLLKTTEEENHSFKRQVEELREHLNNKDLEHKNDSRTIAELEQQLSEAHNTKERQDEKFRHADRQALVYREENEKIKTDLNMTRERLQRLEERYHAQENENKTYRQQVFTTENNNNRVADDPKLNSTMSLNMPTSREYGRFTLTSSKYSSSAVTTPRDVNLDSARYVSNGIDETFRYGNSSRPLTRLNDYINEKPNFPQPYVPPSRPVYSPKKSSPNHHGSDIMPVRDLVDNHIKQSEQLEEKFDDLLNKKRDLESCINRIPTRGLTATDRQLLDVLEREIDRVEQQISSVKLELRKMNIIRAY